MIFQPNQTKVKFTFYFILMVTSTYDTLPSSNIIRLFTFNSKAHGVMILHEKPKLATHRHVVQYLQDDT